MRKSTLILAGLAAFSAWALPTLPERIELPENFDPMNLNFSFPIDKVAMEGMEKPQAQNAPVVKKGKMKEIRRADAAQSEYFTVAQKYHKGYTFNYDGGDVTTYNIGVTVDGDKVTISNLFNLEAQSTDWSKGVDYDVVGTYDADAKTITIPASGDFETATICGTIGTSYTEILLAGTVTEDGKLAAAPELVLNVVGDFEAITTDMDFGIMNYMDPYGSMGMQAIYRTFYATIPSDEPKLMAFNNSFDFGETFPENPASRSMTIVNLSTTDVDFVVDMEADEDAFTADPFAATIEASSPMDITYSLNCATPGEYEGLASIMYEGINTDPQPIQVLLFGTVIPYPDYSAVVSNGDLKLTTGIDHPFEITSLEDGTVVAQSSTKGATGNSYLNVEFEVPEGNIGTFSWKGHTTNLGYWYQNAGGIFIDNLNGAWLSETGEADIDNSFEFGPGKHFVRFQYDAYYYTGNEKNCLYVYDLNFESAPAEAVAVEVKTPNLNLGNFLITDENGIEGYGSIVLLNRGTEPLAVNTATADNAALEVAVPNTVAGLLETIELPVTIKTSEPQEVNSVVTIDTSAGVVTANVKSIVRKMADFSQIVTEGAELITYCETDTQNPFDVKDGVAFNTNAGTPDDTPYVTSWFRINFTVPSGKAAIMSWDGHLDAQINEENPYSADYGMIGYSHPMNSGSGPYILGNADAGSATVYADEIWAPQLTCIPGNHYIDFRYVKNGDGIMSEKDMLEISNVRFHLEDFPEHGVSADKQEIVFEPIYVGENRYLTDVITIKNTGSEPLEVLDVTADHPFYGVFKEGEITSYGRTAQIGVWFYPSEEGEFEGEIVFKTTGGDIPVHCYGSTKEAEGILLIGDVENEGLGWSFYDADGDGECWNLGYNLWGNNPAWVHEGADCFGSASYSWYGGYIEPDNWLFSPMVSVPEDGAKLRWFAASHHHERYAENYSVYIAYPDQVADVTTLDSMEPVFSETLEPESADTWVENVIDLDEYAGEDVFVVFRHHDCNGQYVLKIDDIFVYTNEKWDYITGVENISADGLKAVSTEIFDVNGIRLNTLTSGVNVIRVTYSDGSVKAHKLIVK